MKKIMYFFAAVIIACSMVFTTTSCSKDEDEWYRGTQTEEVLDTIFIGSYYDVKDYYSNEEAYDTIKSYVQEPGTTAPTYVKVPHVFTSDYEEVKTVYMEYVIRHKYSYKKI